MKKSAVKFINDRNSKNKPAEIVPNLAEQLRSSVRWTDSIRYLIRQGGMEFEEQLLREVA